MLTPVLIKDLGRVSMCLLSPGYVRDPVIIIINPGIRLFFALVRNSALCYGIATEKQRCEVHTGLSPSLCLAAL